MGRAFFHLPISRPHALTTSRPHGSCCPPTMKNHMPVRSLSGGRLVAVVCAAQVLVQIGAFFWPALLPTMMPPRALTGLGWAGTYMTGLKLLADQVDAKLMSRAVTGHAASIGISGALSFSCAGLLADRKSVVEGKR